jgi:hypothetical protein
MGGTAMLARDARRLRRLPKEEFDAIKNNMVEGIKRLLDGMDDDVFTADYKTTPQIEQRNDIFIAILWSLARPADHEGMLDSLLDEAAMDIAAALQEYSQLRGREPSPEITETATGGMPTQEAQPTSAAPITTTHSPRAEPNTAAQDDHTPANPLVVPPFASPYVKHMVVETIRIGATVTHMPKKELTYELEQHWPSDLGEPSKHFLGSMATFMRAQEAQSGRRVQPEH